MNIKTDGKLRQKIKVVLKTIFFDELIRKRSMVAVNNILYLQSSLFKRTYKNKPELLDYKKILSKEYFNCKEYYKGNHFYGIADSIKTYSNYKKPIKAIIEHGVYFGDVVPDVESTKSGLPAVITFSNERKRHIHKKSKKPVFAIGPYLYYAKDYCSNTELLSYKNNFGKTLLVFPSHSVDRVRTKFNMNEFVEKIHSFKETHSFDNVIVCLYYRDIELGRADIYEGNGFIVTTAGRREDPFFSMRLKSLFNLSDYSISNSVGTHIGYSVLVGKPHMIITQKTTFEADYAPDLEQAPELIFEQSMVDKEEVIRAFSEYSEVITEEQKNICSKFWGFNNIRSKEELLYILNFCDKVFKKSRKKEKRYIETSNELKDKELNNTDKKLLEEALSLFSRRQ